MSVLPPHAHRWSDSITVPVPYMIRRASTFWERDDVRDRHIIFTLISLIASSIPPGPCSIRRRFYCRYWSCYAGTDVECDLVVARIYFPITFKTWTSFKFFTKTLQAIQDLKKQALGTSADSQDEASDDSSRSNPPDTSRPFKAPQDLQFTTQDRPSRPQEFKLKHMKTSRPEGPRLKTTLKTWNIQAPRCLMVYDPSSYSRGQ
ncbi:hypothetical protein B0H13DRAFT_1887967 [Mycena leptocephala]|nr:hypothetical protein B0H13DRAFT_1887967 [Mycena leptocephala]